MFPFNSLNQSLEEFRSIVNAKVNEHPICQYILEQLQDNSQQGMSAEKLHIHLFHKSLSISEQLCRFLNTSNILNCYQFHPYPLPDINDLFQLLSTFVLVLRPDVSQHSPSRYWNLSQDRHILIGREYRSLVNTDRNRNAALIDLPHCSNVSSVHAEIRPVMDFRFNAWSWQICDLNSRNGTYVNGQRLYGCQFLKTGDRITLGQAHPGRTAPELIFEDRLTSLSNYCQPSSSLTISSTDIACLVLNPQEFNEQEQEWIEVMGRSGILKLILMVDTASNPSLDLNAQATITSWIKAHCPNLDLEWVDFPIASTLNLKSNDQSLKTALTKLRQVCLVGDPGQIQSLVQRRLTLSTSRQINWFENFLTDQIRLLHNRMQDVKTELGQQSVEHRSQFGGTISTIQTDLEDGLRQLTAKLHRDQQDLLSEFKSQSMHYKIKTLVDSLEPVVTRQNGQVYIQLQSTSKLATHQVMMHFYDSELTAWVNYQWHQIYHTLAGHPHGLVQSSNQRLRSMLEGRSHLLLSQLPMTIDIHQTLKTSLLVKPACTQYFENSLAKDAISGVAKLAIQVGIDIGLAALLGPVALMEHTAAIMHGLFDLTGNTLSQAQVKALKLEEVVAQLREKTCAYYQGLARYLLDRVVEQIENLLYAEIRCLIRSLQEIESQLEYNRLDLEQYLRQLQGEQMALQQQQQHLAQLKSSIGGLMTH